MRLTSIVSLSAALLLSSTGHAQDKKLASNEQPSTSATYQAPAEAPAVVEKKICKRLSVSGTRMADRVCLTKQEWAKVDQEK